MAEMKIPIVRGERTAATDYLDRLPKNMIAVAKPIRGSAGYLITHDGLKRYATGLGADRGGFYNDRQAVHYRVSGNNLINLGVDASVTSVGTISGGDQASFAYSFNNQLVVADGKAWLCNGTTTTQITDPDLGSPIDCCWIDNYFFYTDGEFIFHSLITNESQIDPLQFSTAAFMPDKSLGVMTTQDNLVLVFGRYTMEYFVNQANPNFAFSRIGQKSMFGGIVGTHAKCMLDGQVFILGGRKDESVRLQVVGAGQLTPVSTRSVDDIINSYTEQQLSTAVLESRSDARDKVVIVRLPNHTLMFNYNAAQAIGADNAWSILSYGTDNAPWLGLNGVFDPRISKWVYGSRLTNALYTLDPTNAMQDTEPTECEFYTPIIPTPSMRIGTIELDTVSGYSTTSVQVSMAVSHDMTTETLEYINVYGGAFQYGRKFKFWRSVGFVSGEFSLAFRCVSPDKINVSNLVINYV
jgi:hypothetical protein